jgi:hypothetical protein
MLQASWPSRAPAAAALAGAVAAFVMAKSRAERHGNGCPAGLLPQELDECLADLGNEAGDSPLDALRRLAVCRSSDRCRAPGV